MWIKHVLLHRFLKFPHKAVITSSFPCISRHSQGSSFFSFYLEKWRTSKAVKQLRRIEVLKKFNSNQTWTWSRILDVSSILKFLCSPSFSMEKRLLLLIFDTTTFLPMLAHAIGQRIRLHSNFKCQEWKKRLKLLPSCILLLHY